MPTPIPLRSWLAIWRTALFVGNEMCDCGTPRKTVGAYEGGSMVDSKDPSAVPHWALIVSEPENSRAQGIVSSKFPTDRTVPIRDFGVAGCSQSNGSIETL